MVGIGLAAGHPAAFYEGTRRPRSPADGGRRVELGGAFYDLCGVDTAGSGGGDVDAGAAGGSAAGARPDAGEGGRAKDAGAGSADVLTYSGTLDRRLRPAGSVPESSSAPASSVGDAAGPAALAAIAAGFDYPTRYGGFDCDAAVGAVTPERTPGGPRCAQTPLLISHLSRSLALLAQSSGTAAWRPWHTRSRLPCNA